MPLRKMNISILALISLSLVTVARTQASSSASTTSISAPASTERAVHGCGEPSLEVDDNENAGYDADAANNEAAPPVKMPPALVEQLKQMMEVGDKNTKTKDSSNTFRVDFGTPDFMHASPDDEGTSGLSEREKFIARMNAARNSNPAKSWSDDYETLCSATVSLSFEIYPFKPADPHSGWAWAAEQLDACQHGPWPGGFTADEREWRILRTDFEDLPKSVQEHYEKNPENGAMCIIDGVAFFPPGVVIGWMPLFIAGGECGGKFADLRRYGKDVAGERVAGRLVGKSEIGNSVQVTVAADLLRKKTLGKDEL